MCCNEFWKRIIPFVGSLIFGLLMTNILCLNYFPIEGQEYKIPADEITVPQNFYGVTGCYPNGFPTKNRESVTSFIDVITENYAVSIYDVKIISETLPKYTESAKKNKIQGNVILRVTFLANGKIGKIFVIKDLPDGLTEQAISAAKQIKFEPASGHGTRKSRVTTVTYTFSLN